VPDSPSTEVKSAEKNRLQDLISYATKFLGIRYVYGGTTPKSGFDCSGYVRYVFKKFGIDLPRTSQDQARSGVAVDHKDLSPGDLVFSDWGEGANSHVAIYAGKGKIIEAPRTGLTVRVADLNSGYLAHVNGYRRVTSKKKGFLDSIESIAGDVVGDVASASGLGGLLSFPSEIVNFFSQATNGVSSTIEFFTAFFRPSTYVRIGAGVMGSIFLMAGIAFLLWEAKE